jgi:hypothetical protein
MTVSVFDLSLGDGDYTLVMAICSVRVTV